jgi:hypothetical protein
LGIYPRGDKAEKPSKQQPSRNMVLRLAFLFGELFLGSAGAMEEGGGPHSMAGRVQPSFAFSQDVERETHWRLWWLPQLKSTLVMQG